MEIAIYTGETIEEPRKGKLYRKLRGSVVGGVTFDRIRRKWTEVCGALLSPDRRDSYPSIPMWTTITNAWRQEWYDIFRLMQQELIETAVAWQMLLDAELPDLGMDPNGHVPLVDTWRWTPKERRMFLLGRIDSEDVGIARKIDYSFGEGEATGRATVVDYRTACDYPQGEINDIEDPEVDRPPILNVTWDATLAVPVCEPGDIIVRNDAPTEEEPD